MVCLSSAARLTVKLCSCAYLTDLNTAMFDALSNGRAMVEIKSDNVLAFPQLFSVSL